MKQDRCGFLPCWLALVPFVGLLPAIYALISVRKIRAGYKDTWNPAAGYLRLGSLLARIGFFTYGTLIFLIVTGIGMNLL